MSVKELNRQGRICTKATLHSTNINLATATKRGCLTLHEVEIAQPLEFVVIRNASRATAETNLGANIQIEFRSTV